MIGPDELMGFVVVDGPLLRVSRTLVIYAPLPHNRRRFPPLPLEVPR